MPFIKNIHKNLTFHRSVNNCGQSVFEKNIYFIVRLSTHFQSFYFNERLGFVKDQND